MERHLAATDQKRLGAIESILDMVLSVTALLAIVGGFVPS
jgi:hypothetical protein